FAFVVIGVAVLNSYNESTPKIIGGLLTGLGALTILFFSAKKCGCFKKITDQTEAAHLNP
ncbi:MAG: hypothetical protein NTV32_00700, partial [Gammaproteobacteria bacterium]|nr:hypothetical protein [Gammaproteobacteria bacterium]